MVYVDIAFFCCVSPQVLEYMDYTLHRLAKLGG